MFVPICGPVVADSIYVDGKLVARDVAVTLPEVAATTYEIQAMGVMTMPDWSRLADMETTVSKNGIDKNLALMSTPGAKRLEIRGVQPVTDAGGNIRNVGFKAEIVGYSNKIPSLGVSVGDPTESELTYATTRYRLFVDNEEMWCLDRLAYICRIDGIDYADKINSLL